MAKKSGFIQEKPQKQDFSITWGSIQEWGCNQADTVSYLECIGSARGNSATVTCFDFENGFAVLPARQLLDEPFFNCMHHLVAH